jgi:hypothetical protein
VSGNRLRVNVQLVDAETANHMWAERFDKPIADLFDMQDEIVSRLANALNAQLIAAEARRAENTLHPDAMDLYFLGRTSFNKGQTLENLTQARRFLERALALDPLISTHWLTQRWLIYQLATVFSPTTGPRASRRPRQP